MSTMKPAQPPAAPPVAPSFRDPLLDSLIAHLRTGAEAMTAALDAAVAIRDRQATLVAHEQARVEDAARKAAEKRSNPPTLMKDRSQSRTPTPESAA